MKIFLLIIKGFIIGIANIIPGVSGGSLALILGVYERIINFLSSFWKNFIDNLKFIVPLLIGVIAAIICGSFAISLCLNNFPIETTMFFIGLIIGGLPFIYKKIHKKFSVINIIIFVVIAGLTALLCNLSKNNNVDLTNLDFVQIIKLFVVGAIAAATMIIPGISGSLTLMSLGYYDEIIGSIKGLTSFSEFGHNVCILLPFGLGVIVGLILIARLIKFLLKRFPTQSYFAILAFIIASIYGIVIQIKATNYSGWNFLIGFILMLIGGFITYSLALYDDTKNKKEANEIN